MLKSLCRVPRLSAGNTIVALVLFVSTWENAFATTNFLQLDTEVRSTLQTVLCGTERPSPKKGERSWDMGVICGVTNRLGDVSERDLARVLAKVIEDGSGVRFREDGRPILLKKEDGNAFLLTYRAIALLGEMRCREMSGVLEKIARTSPGRQYRYRAVQSLMRIADTNMVPFARDLLTGKSSYSVFVFYRELPLYLEDKSYEEIRQEMTQLLMNVVCSTPGWGMESSADSFLCVASEQWRKSHEREAFLERFKDTDNTTYYADQLKALQAIPAAERTHVEVHPLRMDSPRPRPRHNRRLD